MEKYVIINADDFGSFQCANQAVFDLLESGGITSSTVMMPCPWSKQACQWSAAHPEHAVGVHLTFTSEWKNYRWSPVNWRGKTDSLRDEEGYMVRQSDEFETKCDIDQVEAEIRAQIELAKLLGLNPSHIDNHMGSLYGIETGRVELLQLVFNIAAEYKLPFRFPMESIVQQADNQTLGINIDKEMLAQLFGRIQSYAKSLGVITPDYLIPHEWDGMQKESYQNFRDYLYTFIEEFPHGVTETYLHPALDDGEIRSASSVAFRRVWEYMIYKDPKTLQHYKDCGIKPISYRDLAKMKG